jgi:peptidoglycan/LPS O-acetylase OafA/YrhL
MKPPLVNSSYNQPLAVNTALLVLVGCALLPIVLGSANAGNDHAMDTAFYFLVATLLLPGINACFFLYSLACRNWQRALIYGILTTVFLLIAKAVASLTAGAFQKVGG